MIGNKFYKEIIKLLESHQRFEGTDFKVEMEKKGDDVQLKIRYQAEPRYYISFSIPSTTSVDGYGKNLGYVFSGLFCPGPIAYLENFKFAGKEGVFKKITEWQDSTWDELMSNPIVKKIDAQQSQINNIMEGFQNLDDVYFTDEEAADLKIRLDNLENNLKTEMQNNKETKKEQEAEINKLHNDIETLKETIASLKKKGWLISFAGKVVKWTMNADNRKVLGDGYKVVRGFLPEEVKINLPE